MNTETVKVTCQTKDYLPLDRLTPFQGELKSLSKDAFAKLKKSILKHGITFPVFVWKQNGSNNILDGTQRDRVLAAMAKEGYDIPPVPVVYVDAKDAKEAKEKILLLSSQYGRMDDESLHEFIELAELDFKELKDLIDLPQLNLDKFERSYYSEPVVEGPEPQFDKAEELRAKYGVELGQIWELGEHRLMCGDSTKDAVALLNGVVPKYGLHDPPYGIDVVGISATVGGAKPFGKGRIGFDGVVKANTYSAVIGDDKQFDPAQLLAASEYCFLWGANYYADKLPPMKGWVVWDKKGRDDWRDTFSDCELAWTNIKTVTRIFRHVWLGMVQEGEREKRVHPTQKPANLYQKIISELFKEDGVIIDYYLGSGTTLIACEQLNRKCYAMEISEAYTAVAIQRWVDLTGGEAKLLR
jgi:DNA modification methylase